MNKCATLSLFAVLLAACSAYAPVSVSPGQSVEEVAQALGPPTGRYALPDGRSRLEYARGPFGKQTWMIDVDAAGKVVAVEQVLTEANFHTVVPGSTRDELLTKLGRPTARAGMIRNAELWSYRYATHVCQWFVVTLEADGRVRDSGYVIDPRCDAGRNDAARGS